MLVGLAILLLWSSTKGLQFRGYFSRGVKKTYQRGFSSAWGDTPRLHSLQIKTINLCLINFLVLTLFFTRMLPLGITVVFKTQKLVIFKFHHGIDQNFFSEKLRTILVPLRRTLNDILFFGEKMSKFRFTLCFVPIVSYDSITRSYLLRNLNSSLKPFPVISLYTIPKLSLLHLSPIYLCLIM